MNAPAARMVEDCFPAIGVTIATRAQWGGRGWRYGRIERTRARYAEVLHKLAGITID